MPRPNNPFPPMRIIWRGDIPRVVAALIGAIAVTTLACLLTDGSSLALRRFLELTPFEVWHGQVWRVVTYSLVAEDLLSLVLAGLMLYWLGRDLATHWGTRRFLTALVGAIGFAGVMTALAGLVSPRVYMHPYLGIWPLTEALMLGWAATFRDREIRLFMMMPARGQQLIVFTVALLVIWGFTNGIVAILPHAFAQLFMAAFTGLLTPPSLRARLQRLVRRRRSGRLRSVDDDRPHYWN